MITLKLLFLVLSLVCFALKFFGVATGRVDTFAGGFLFALLWLAV